MDISVSRLNERMALQLPAQFPLGLVFVVGTVESPPMSVNGEDGAAFFLIEREHRLRCLLSARAAESITLVKGSEIRAGGHLAFDPTRADYFLFARDIELMPHEAARVSSLAAIIRDFNMRSEAAGLTPAELPDWVKRMAPPEIREELPDTISQPPEIVPEPLPPEIEVVQGPRAGQLGLGHEVAIAGLSDELLDFLSEAMDSNEDVELTPELVAEYNPPSSTGAAGDLDGAPEQTESRPAETQEETSAETDEDGENSGGRRKLKMPWIAILVVLIILLLATATTIFLYLFV